MNPSSSPVVDYTCNFTPSIVSVPLDQSPPSPLSVDLRTFPSPGPTLFSPVEFSPSTAPEPLPPTTTTTRRGDPSRIPRPRNAFMIFRSHTLAQRSLLPKSVEHDHRHISRIIAHLWSALPEPEKNVYRAQADREKVEHMRKYPNYRFEPTMGKYKRRRNVKRNSDEDLERCKRVAEFLMAGKRGEDLDRAVKDLPNAEDAPPRLNIPTKRRGRRSAVPKQPTSPSEASSSSTSSSPASTSTLSLLSTPALSTPAISPSPLIHGWVPPSGEPETVDIGPVFLSPLLPPDNSPDADFVNVPLMDSLQPPPDHSSLWQLDNLSITDPYYSTPHLVIPSSSSPQLYYDGGVYDQAQPLSFNYEVTNASQSSSPSPYQAPNNLYPNTLSLYNMEPAVPFVVGDEQMPISYSLEPVGWNQVLYLNPAMLEVGMGNIDEEPGCLPPA
ncbi:hypothetical protein VNI00_002048 [Paramarasmius palmivorus]|uniref:HMG box domain-containing protein n=1 Tax=Paramarasmius palmivorus TaxID=297713 RepID=A0AAW0E3V4_9AGAR